MLLTCIKLTSVFKTFVLSIFEWSLKTGFTVVLEGHSAIHYYIYTVVNHFNVLGEENWLGQLKTGSSP